MAAPPSRPDRRRRHYERLLRAYELLNRRVAVKVLVERVASAPRRLRQLRREAELWAGLAHPLVVAVFDGGAVPRPFIAMELVPE